MKNIFSILALCFLTANLFAQDLLKPEVSKIYQIQLNDGSYLRATDLQADEANLVNITLVGGTVIQVPGNSVLSIKESKKKFLIHHDGKTSKNNGYYNIIQLSTLGAYTAEAFERDPETRLGFGLSYTGGYQIKSYLSVGAGVGFDAYEHVLMPIFLDIRGNLTKKRTVPYYAINAGYSLPFGDWVEKDHNEDGLTVHGGLFIYPAVGFKFASRRNATFQMDIGYNFQKLRRDLDWFWGISGEERITYKSIVLRFGVAF